MDYRWQSLTANLKTMIQLKITKSMHAIRPAHIRLEEKLQRIPDGSLGESDMKDYNTCIMMRSA